MADTASDKRDIQVLRELARKYAEAAAKPIQDVRRKLWSDHIFLKHAETVHGDVGHRARWVRIVREEIEQIR